MANNRQLDNLRMPLRDLNAQSQIDHARVERLRRELDAATKDMVQIDRSYREHLMHYARAECLQLANMMHQKLPLELRELIYEYLCVEPDRPILVGPYYHFRKYDRPLHRPPDDDQNDYDDMDEEPGIEETDQDIEEVYIDDETTMLPDGRVKADHSHRPPSDMILPGSHFLNPRYVGPVMSHEIQKMYYTRNTFSVCNVEDAVDHLLWRPSGYSMKKWEPDSHPPKIHQDLKLEPLFLPFQYIRKLQIRVKCEQFFENQPRQAAPTEEYMYEQHFLRFTERQVRELQRLGPRRTEHRLEIEFIIMTQLPSNWLTTNHRTRTYDRHFINVLEAIRETVYTISHEILDSVVKVTHYDEQVSIFPRDITGMFALTKEQWEFEKSASSMRKVWMPLFYVAPLLVPGDSLMSGFHEVDLDRLLVERWGVDSVKDTKAKHPVKQGRFWPSGSVSEAGLELLREWAPPDRPDSFSNLRV